MDSVNKKLIEKIKKLNQNINNKVKRITDADGEPIRNKLLKIGSFYSLNKINKDYLATFKPMACVDGSVNRYGGSYPHYIEIFQGLAKIGGGEFESIFTSNVYTPFDNPLLVEEEDVRKQLLAKIEIEAALKAVNNYQLKFLLMDGNLIRYNIEAPDEFKILIDLCKEKNVLIAGFIKEVKSNTLFELIYENSFGINMYDKDLLYGILNKGEAFYIDDKYNKKIEQGFHSLLLRTSNYPGITGLEVLSDQKDFLLDIANICFTLTPEMSRGVPLIIDIVDQEVKIDSKLTEELISSYIDRDLVERYFKCERSMRKY